MTDISFTMHQGREFWILGLAIAFILLLGITQKMSTIKLVLRVIFTMLVVFGGYYIVAALGFHITFYTIIVAIVVGALNLLIKDGINKKAFSELASGLVTTGICGIIVYFICKFNNVNFIDKFELNGITSTPAFVFAISVMFFLGIFMDLTSRIIFVLDLEKDKTTDIPLKEQFKEGFRISKDFIKEKINMIFLALSAISFIFISIQLRQNMNIINILNTDIIFTLIVMGIVGSIGLILAVWISALFYSIFNRKKTIYKKTSDNKIEGKRSLKL